MTSNALADLASRLQPFRAGITATPAWQARQAMTDALQTVRQRHRPSSRVTRRGRVLDGVQRYLDTGQLLRPQDIFDLCLGAGWLDADGHGILADVSLRRKLFDLAATARGRNARLRAFRRLLLAYWSFPLHDPATPLAASNGWRELRDWLRQRHTEIARHPARQPAWFAVLSAHLHLLAENPCARYGRALLKGNLDELQQAINRLSIPTGSWVKGEAVMALVADACTRPDGEYLALLPGALQVISGAAGIRFDSGVTRSALARLLLRHARQRAVLPHETLFAQAVRDIGNPLQSQSAWDAGVRDGGAPCIQSREMVSAWLKDGTIAAFFGDADEDAPRIAFWQGYAVFMAALAPLPAGADGVQPALLAHLADYLAFIPRAAAHAVELYPWRALSRTDHAALLGKEYADGATLQAITTRGLPVRRLRQDLPEQCADELRSLLFSPTQ